LFQLKNDSRPEAERTAAMHSCASASELPEVREDHAAYIGSWIKALRNDKRAIFSAVSHAQRATD
jgi:antirestriction protein ArdC